MSDRSLDAGHEWGWGDFPTVPPPDGGDLSAALADLRRQALDPIGDWRDMQPTLHPCGSTLPYKDAAFDDFFPLILPEMKNDFPAPQSSDPEPVQLDEVVVVGRRRPGEGGWSGGDYDSSGWDWDGYDTSQPELRQDPPAPPRPEGWSECKDKRIDELAEQAANAILAMHDDDVKEYGFLIWEDDQGVLHLSDMIAGDNWRLTGLTLEFLAAQGIDPAQVVGLVHSHPLFWHRTDENGNPLYRHDGEPDYVTATTQDHWAHVPSEDDWLWLDTVFGPRNPSFSMMRNYIVFDGTMYEYDLYQNPNIGDDGLRRALAKQASNANG